MFKKMKIKTKLMLGFASVMIVALLGMGLSNYQSAQTILSKTIDKNLNDTLVSVIGTIEATVHTSVKSYLQGIAEEKFHIAR